MRILGVVFGCVLVAGVWIGCSDKDPVSSLHEGDVPAVAAKKGGKAGKVDVCHITGTAEMPGVWVATR